METKSLHHLLQRFFIGIITLFVLLYPYKATAQTVTPVPGDGFYYNIGTPTGSNGSYDAVTWSTGNPIMIDKYGNYIVPAEPVGNGYQFEVSNNKGVSWSEINPQVWMHRLTAVYDPVSDKIHTITTESGVPYRRFSIIRNSSNQITNIIPDTSMPTLFLDPAGSCSTVDIRNPLALWKDNNGKGILVLFWSIGKTCGTQSITETRASMLPLSNTSADGTSSNWKALNGISDGTGAVGPAAVAYTKLYSYNGIYTPFQQSALIKTAGQHVNDIYYFNIDQNDTHGMKRLTWNSTANNWSGGFTTRVLFGGNVGDSNGYNLKKELLSKPVEDTVHDRVYVGIARWLNNTAGDTQSLFYITNSDTVSLASDIYSAGGVHCIYPTFDLMYDPVSSNVLFFYDISGTSSVCGNAYYKTFNGTSLSSPKQFFTVSGQSVDIPIVAAKPDNGNAILFFRKNNTQNSCCPPHEVFFGYVPLTSNTPTPTTPFMGLGDVNTDGKVDALDIKALLSTWLWATTNSYDQYGDGLVNALDVVRVIKQLPILTPTQSALSPTPTGATMTNKALQFNPLATAVDTLEGVDLGTSFPGLGSIFTVEAFINFTGNNSTYDVIIGRQNWGVEDWVVSIDGGLPFGSITYDGVHGGTKQVDVLGVTPVAPNSWHHIAFVANGTQYSLYMDGKLEKTAVQTGPIFNSGTAVNLFMGRKENPTQSAEFHGIIDEVRISNTARYSGSAYTVPTTQFTADANTLGLWHINEGTGTTISDSSGHNYTGTIQQTPRWVTGYSF